MLLLSCLHYLMIFLKTNNILSFNANDLNDKDTSKLSGVDEMKNSST